MPLQRDFGSHLPESSSTSGKPKNARGLRGAWLDDSDRERSSNLVKTLYQARDITQEALADLQRAVSNVDTEKKRQQTLRSDYYAAKDKDTASAAAAKSNEKPTLIYKTPRSEYYAVKDREMPLLLRPRAMRSRCWPARPSATFLSKVRH